MAVRCQLDLIRNLGLPGHQRDRASFSVSMGVIAAVAPPSQTMSVPVRYPALSLAQNASSSAISEGRPNRFSALSSAKPPAPADSSSFPMGVSNEPGETETTRAPLAPNCAAIVLLYQMTKFLLRP